MLANLVDDNHLPPKVLIVHRFTHPMLKRPAQITLDPRVQIVIDMDGFGPDWMKRVPIGRTSRQSPCNTLGSSCSTRTTSQS